VEGSLALGQFLVCRHARALFVCASVAGGFLRGVGVNLSESQEVVKPYVALGGRFGAAVPLDGLLSVRFHLDLLSAVVRTTLLVGDEHVWRQPVLAGTLSALLAMSFS
jgi:hypothetical protein